MIRFLLTALLLISALTGCTSSRRFWLTEERFPATPAGQEVKLYVNEVRRPHVRVAYVQSTALPEATSEVKRRQLEELTKEARRVGADAVIGVRQLKNQVRGVVLDEATPFKSYQQGRYELYFLRGTAIRFTDGDGADAAQPAAQPSPADPAVPEPEAVDPEESLPYEVVPRGLGPVF